MGFSNFLTKESINGDILSISQDLDDRYRLNNRFYSIVDILADNAQIGEMIGTDVALSSDGNTLAIGASQYNSGTGRVQIWVKSGTTWGFQQTILANTTTVDTIPLFGYSVALSSDGNTIAIGCINYEDKTSHEGMVEIWTRSGSTWTFQKILIDTGLNESNKYFGYSVALSSDGNTLAVGATGIVINTNANTGRVSIFIRSGSTWTFQDDMSSSDHYAGEKFGNSIALSSDGNTVAIGAFLYTGSMSLQGKVEVWTRTGGVWSFQQLITADAAEANDYFGYSISLSSNGNILAVGANYFDFYTGKVQVWTRSGSTWSFQQTLTAQPTDSSNEYYGNSVSLNSDGNILFIGGNGYDSNKGRVQEWIYTNNLWTFKQSLSFSTSTELYYGLAISTNSTGNTLAVGCPYYDGSTGSDQGLVEVLMR